MEAKATGEQMADLAKQLHLGSLVLVYVRADDQNKQRLRGMAPQNQQASEERQPPVLTHDCAALQGSQPPADSGEDGVRGKASAIPAEKHQATAGPTIQIMARVQ